jgi:uncharacterized protein (TIGR00255 family)
MPEVEGGLAAPPMSLLSMTGFARADGGDASVRWHWEIRSVNGRGLDVRCRLPQGFEAIEPVVRDRVAALVRRGNCQVNLQLAGSEARSRIAVNEAALAQVLAVVDRLKQRADLAAPHIDGLLALRGVLEDAEAREGAEEVAARQRAVLGALDDALQSLDAMRRAEGARLGAVLAEQIARIETLARSAEACPARAPEAIARRLAEQVARLLDNSFPLDRDRLHQEAMLLAAKADIQEELDRLFSHVEAARTLLSAPEPAGRRLEFLTQEFNREANTICSKANDHELTRIGLELKAVIDQMREQVQNIE